MKVFPFKIPKPHADALLFQVDRGQVFYDKLHQHAEFQLSFIAQGEGTLMVGDSINNYKAGDLFVFGENLPHVFISDNQSDQRSEMYSLFFMPGAFGEIFFELPETAELIPFFAKAEQGALLRGYGNKWGKALRGGEELSKFQRLKLLLDIMHEFATGPTQVLSNFAYSQLSDADGTRMSDVMSYTFNNFAANIRLEDVANCAALSKNAFCKYFKKRTNKTYFQFLAEVRIDHACKLLTSHTDLPVSEIAQRCGYHNLSNFNRYFRTIKNESPMIYRNRWLGRISVEKETKKGTSN